VPGNPDELKQEEFVANYNKLSENLAEDEEILFLDGVRWPNLSRLKNQNLEI
jgi:hypothetical protein